MIDQLMVQAGVRLQDLDAIAFGRGPGSFMGVRIAAGVAQGIAFAWSLPVVPVSTLAAIAQTANAQTGAPHVLAAIDARMNEVYWGAYSLSDAGHMQLVGEELVIAPERVTLPEGREWSGAGTGWSAHGESLRRAIAPLEPALQLDDCLPSAAAIAGLAVADFQAGRHVAAGTERRDLGV